MAIDDVVGCTPRQSPVFGPRSTLRGSFQNSRNKYKEAAMCKYLRLPVWLTCLVISLTLLAGGVAESLPGRNEVVAGTVAGAIGQMTPGRTVRLTVSRDGRERDFSVALGEQPREGSDSTSETSRSQSARVLDGISAETLTPELARQFGIPINVKGVLIRRIDPSSEAAQAGLAPEMSFLK